MLFIVTLTYRRSAAEIEAQLDAHRDWLLAHSREGRIIVAGPLESRTGGLVIAHCAGRAEVDRMMAQDPFVIHGLVGVDVRGMTPALRHDAFSPRWAEGARSIEGA
jgi:uncharacterized protein YciI